MSEIFKFCNFQGYVILFCIISMYLAFFHFHFPVFFVLFKSTLIIYALLKIPSKRFSMTYDCQQSAGISKIAFLNI